MSIGVDVAVVLCVDQVANPSAVAGSPCPAGQGLMVQQIQFPDAASPYDGVQASGFFFFGFGVIIFAYLLGFAVAQVRKPIRQGS